MTLWVTFFGKDDKRFAVREEDIVLFRELTDNEVDMLKLSPKRAWTRVVVKDGSCLDANASVPEAVDEIVAKLKDMGR